MVHVDLFSGIGGFALACEWAGIETICFCECDDFCQEVLRKHWPDVAIVKDVRNVEEIVANTQLFGCVHRQTSEYATERYHQAQCQSESSTFASLLLTAGFPCQPFSAAGRRKGSADDRYLWPETLAVIEAVKSDWIVLENVAGILSMVFPNSAVGVASQASFLQIPNDEIADHDTISGRIDGNLRQAGYETVWLVIPACAVNAPHRRDRVWVIAHAINDTDRTVRRQIPEANRIQGVNRQTLGCRLPTRADSDAANSSYRHGTSWGLRVEVIPEKARNGETIRSGCSYQNSWPENWYEVATRFCRMDDGVPNRVDRLKSLGNAIVPQVAYEIIKAIVEIEKSYLFLPKGV